MVVRLMHGRTDRVTYEEVKRKGVWLISFPFSFSSSFLTSSYVPLSLVTGDGSGSYKVTDSGYPFVLHHHRHSHRP